MNFIYTFNSKDIKSQRLCNENSECITWHSDSFCDGNADLDDGSDEVGCNSKYLNFDEY